MKTIQERLSDFITSTQSTVTSFASEIGTSQPSLSAILNGTRPLSRGMIARINQAYPSLNADWLLTGEGDMLRAQEALVPMDVPPTPAANFTKGVPYYNVDFVLGFDEQGFPSAESPECLIYMPKYSKATLWCNATGNSMTPEINNGDLIALKKVEDPSIVIYGEIYGIITRNGLRTIKRIGKSKEKGCYRLIPTNKEYDDQDLPKSDILYLYQVIGSLHSF